MPSPQLPASQMPRSKVFVAGHKGMVGSAICRALANHHNIEIITRDKSELDLINQRQVTDFIRETQPNTVVVAAAKVGGIQANNSQPASFIYDNLMIESNLIHAAFLTGVDRLLFLGSSCIYPKLCEQPMKEAALLSGPLELTNEPYAVAKIAGIKLCESYNRQYDTDFRSIMPTNLYGPGDNFSLETSHVIPALVRKFHDAKVEGSPSVEIWGTGNARREFLYVDDMASACLHVLNLPKTDYREITSSQCSHINAGYGEDITIRDLAETVQGVVGYEGNTHYDTSRPDGSPRKLMDSSLIQSIGWSPSIGLAEGLQLTYAWYLENQEQLRAETRL